MTIDDHCWPLSVIGSFIRYGPPFEGILIDAVIKVDVRSGALAGTWSLPDGWYVVSECCFVPKLDSVGGAQDDAADGDRGYLLVFATCTEAERAVTPRRASEGEAAAAFAMARMAPTAALPAPRTTATAKAVEAMDMPAAQHTRKSTGTRRR
jgi:hypothetical protein